MNTIINSNSGLHINPVEYGIINRMIKIKGQSVKLYETLVDTQFNYIGFDEKLIELLKSNKINQSQFIFLFIMMRNVRRNEGKVTLNIKKIASEMKVCDQTVRNHISFFCSLKLIDKITGKGSANQYRVEHIYMFSGNRIKFLMQIDEGLVTQKFEKDKEE